MNNAVDMPQIGIYEVDIILGALPPGNKLHAIELLAIRICAARGITMAETALDLGISYSKVRRLKKEHGLKFQYGWNNSRTSAINARWDPWAVDEGFSCECEMWEYLYRDMSPSDTAEWGLGRFFGYTPATIRRRIKECGIEMHKRGGNNYRKGKK